MSRLPHAFFARPPEAVAPDLLGKVLVRYSSDGDLRTRIVETEAYLGERDAGSHAFRGPTPRCAVMFGPAGYLYVYRSYGIHACMNVVCGRDGVAGAVLLRAGEPLTGAERMVERRGRHTELTNGPGKLCQALGIDLTHNGLDLEGDEVWIEDDGFVPSAVGRSTRVGLTQGRELPLRWFISDSPWVSRGRPS